MTLQWPVGVEIEIRPIRQRTTLGIGLEETERTILEKPGGAVALLAGPKLTETMIKDDTSLQAQGDTQGTIETMKGMIIEETVHAVLEKVHVSDVDTPVTTLTEIRAIAMKTKIAARGDRKASRRPDHPPHAARNGPSLLVQLRDPKHLFLPKVMLSKAPRRITPSRTPGNPTL